HLAVGGDAEGADERRDRPAQLVAEVQGAVAGGAAGAGRVAEDLRRVLARQLRPARRFPQGAAARTDGDPRVAIDDDLFEGDDEDVAALRALDVDGAGDRVGVRRDAVEAGPPGGDGLVALRLEVAGAGVEGLQLEALAGPDAEERRVAPVKGVLAGQVARDALHGYFLLVGASISLGRTSYFRRIFDLLSPRRNAPTPRARAVQATMLSA